MHRHAISRWEQGEVLLASKAIVLELGKQLRLNEQETRRLLEASLTVPSPVWGVPCNLFFTGRKDTLEVLHQHLSPGTSVLFPKILALHGLGGVAQKRTR